MSALTAVVVMEKVALVCPVATLTVAGTEATLGLLLVRLMVAPGEYAAPLSVRVPVAVRVPLIVVGLSRPPRMRGAEMTRLGIPPLYYWERY